MDLKRRKLLKRAFVTGVCLLPFTPKLFHSSDNQISPIKSVSLGDGMFEFDGWVLTASDLKVEHQE